MQVYSQLGNYAWTPIEGNTTLNCKKEGGWLIKEAVAGELSLPNEMGDCGVAPPKVSPGFWRPPGPVSGRGHHNHGTLCLFSPRSRKAT